MPGEPPGDGKMHDMTVEEREEKERKFSRNYKVANVVKESQMVANGANVVNSCERSYINGNNWSQVFANGHKWLQAVANGRKRSRMIANGCQSHKYRKCRKCRKSRKCCKCLKCCKCRKCRKCRKKSFISVTCHSCLQLLLQLKIIATLKV